MFWAVDKRCAHSVGAHPASSGCKTRAKRTSHFLAFRGHRFALHSAFTLKTPDWRPLRTCAHRFLRLELALKPTGFVFSSPLVPGARVAWRAVQRCHPGTDVWWSWPLHASWMRRRIWGPHTPDLNRGSRGSLGAIDLGGNAIFVCVFRRSNRGGPRFESELQQENILRRTSFRGWCDTAQGMNPAKVGSSGVRSGACPPIASERAPKVFRCRKHHRVLPPA